jgi:hypothetical protein
MPLKDTKFKNNLTMLKLFDSGEDGVKKLKVICLASCRTSGVEDEKDHGQSERGTKNDSKLQESISRTRTKIFELAFCNPWEWFFTATLDPKKYDRTDLEQFHKDFTRFIRKYNEKHNLHIKFLMIPERHADGVSWHMHGFLMGLPVEHLHQFSVGDVMGKKLADKVLKGDAVYNWPEYLSRFGFCDLEPIRSHEAVSKYVTKYISKELAHSVTELNAHLYYRSRGLAGAVEIARGFLQAGTLDEPSYSGEYASVWWLEYSDELLNKLKESIN